jgi:hypothetical protein
MEERKFAAAQRASAWVARYFERTRDFPVLSQVRPGEVAAAMAPAMPEEGAKPRHAGSAQSTVVDEINHGGFAFLSTTRLNERVAIRFAIGNARTTPADVRETWNLLLSTARRRTNS